MHEKGSKSKACYPLPSSHTFGVERNEKRISAIPTRPLAPEVRGGATRATDTRNLAVMSPQRPSLFQTMKEGVAFGVGSSIGHQIVGAMMSPFQSQAPVHHADARQNEYEQCMKEHNDKAVCQEIRSLPPHR